MPSQTYVERAHRVLGLEEAELKLEINQHLVRWTHLLDEAICIPGTSIRFGLDGIIGLIPVVGDVITAGFGLLMLQEATRLGVPKHKRAVMVGNYVIDVVGGLVPFVGDLFDFAFKANKKNLAILQKHVAQVKGEQDLK
ncbi:MAG: DUF4112 domain-containing protein [Gemmataceae bacterium]|nr:DUF4112 domain-containing protein [Gemmataceae bacterium]